MKLTDLRDLRVIKKSLEPEPEPKPQQNQPRKRSVELKSKEEEHARNEGLVMGQKVRMMDTNDTATITGFGKGYYELELDGLPIRAVRSEFIPIDADEDRRLRNAIPSRSHKAAKEEPPSSKTIPAISPLTCTSSAFPAATVSLNGPPWTSR